MKIANKSLITVLLVCFTVLMFQMVIFTYVKAGAINCSGGNCSFIACNNNYECGTNKFSGAKECRGDDIYQAYITYTCNNPGTTDASCTSSLTYKRILTCGSGQYCYYGNCREDNSRSSSSSSYDENSYLKCAGNSVYWFDSNNNQRELYQICSYEQTCSGSSCVTSGYTPPPTYQSTYTPHMFKGCAGNISYWYDSLGNQQDIYQNCNLTGQICSNGGCTGLIYTPAPVIPTPKTTPAPAYDKHYVTKCYSNDIYWHDSKDEVQDLFKSCSDDNECTLDVCGDRQCKNELKCDGSTCTADSEDYLKYCVTAATVSENPLADFLKKWYIWIIIAIILIFLFIIVFRRLSSNV